MTPHDDIEARLRRAVDMAPSPDAIRWLDQRVSRAMARPAAVRGLGRSGRRLILRPLALLAAFVLLTGAVVGAIGLLERAATQSGPGLRLAWDRAEILGLQRADAGITITLERAYADVNQFAGFFTVQGLEAPAVGSGEPPPIEWTAELRDPTGRGSEQWATSRLGTELQDGSLSAHVHGWSGAVTPASGTWELTFSSVGYGGTMVPGECTVGATDPACVNPPENGMVLGTWRFAFEMPAPAGAMVSNRVSDTRGPATLTLSELRVSPTMISSRIALRVAGSTVAYWGPDGLAIRNGDATYTTNSAYHVTQSSRDQGPDGDVNDYTTPVGAAGAAGTWVIEVPAVWYVVGDGGPESQVRLEGPWRLTVEVP
ncbi:MAG: hypothetical protein ACRDHD_10415 [Candidatus Limnocylindria bacterium]